MKTFNILNLAFLFGCILFVACDKDDDEKGKGGNEPIGEVKKISSLEKYCSGTGSNEETKVSFMWANGLLISVVENETYTMKRGLDIIEGSRNCTNSFSYGDDGKLKKIVSLVEDYSWSIQIEYSGDKISKIKEESSDTGEFGEKITHLYELTYDGDYIATITDEDGDVEYLTWKDGNLVSMEEKGKYGYVKNYSYDNNRAIFPYEQNPVLAFVLFYFYESEYTEGLGKNNAVITAYKDNDESYTKDNHTTAIVYTYDNDNYPTSYKYTMYDYDYTYKCVY